MEARLTDRNFRQSHTVSGAVTPSRLLEVSVAASSFFTYLVIASMHGFFAQSASQQGGGILRPD
jgi:hypothetical protein